MMNKILQVNKLRKTIKKCGERIKQVQDSCPHNRIRHKLFPDIYGNQGNARECADCGLQLSVASIPMIEKMENRTWVERRNT